MSKAGIVGLFVILHQVSASFLLKTSHKSTHRLLLHFGDFIDFLSRLWLVRIVLNLNPSLGDINIFIWLFGLSNHCGLSGPIRNDLLKGLVRSQKNYD